MNRTRAPAFHAAEQRLHPGAQVVVLGHVSRTWYIDQSLVCELLYWFDELSIVPVFIGNSAFRETARMAALIVQKLSRALGDDDPAVEQVLVAPDLVVVLPPRKSRDPLQTAPCVSRLYDEHKGILAIFDNGDAEFLRKEPP